MANQRGTFAKRQREMELKDKARAKEARRVAKRGEQRTTKGPEIAWDEAVREIDSDFEGLGATTPSGSDGSDGSDSAGNEAAASGAGNDPPPTE